MVGTNPRVWPLRVAPRQAAFISAMVVMRFTDRFRYGPDRLFDLLNEFKAKMLFLPFVPIEGLSDIGLDEPGKFNGMAQG